MCDDAVALKPPIVVNVTAMPPIINVVIQSGQPKITVNTTAGAYKLMPRARPR